MGVFMCVKIGNEGKIEFYGLLFCFIFYWVSLLQVGHIDVIDFEFAIIIDRS
jgi:hypothetical protein